MARKGTRAMRPKIQKAGGTTVVTMPAAPAPARRRSGGGRRKAAPKRRRSSSRRGSVGGASVQSQFISHVVGGFAVGFIEKSFPNLPSIPFLGRKGSIAALAYFFHGKHPLILDVGKAAAAISGYELGKTGVVTGDVMGDNMAAQM